MHGLLRLGLAALSLSSACGSDRTVTLLPVGASGVQGEVQLHEAFTKSFYFRVDAYLIVANPTPEMRGTFEPGRCGDARGGEATHLAVHAGPSGGGSQVVVPDRMLGDVEGKYAVRVLAGEPDDSAVLACADL